MSDEQSHTDIEPGVIVLGIVCAALLLGLILWLAI
jgi:hypothetical protein